MAKFLTWNDFNNEYDGKPDFNKVTNSTSADIIFNLFFSL